MYTILFIYRGTTTRLFDNHDKDVLSVAFSADNRQIVSGSRDKSIKLWNTLGVCKYTIQVNLQHNNDGQYCKLTKYKMYIWLKRSNSINWLTQLMNL